MSCTKHGREILAVFGLLDAVLLGRFANQIGWPLTSADSSLWYQALEWIRPVFLLSLAFSAIGLILVRRWAIVLSYVQFPLRYAFVLMSFGFLTLVPWFVGGSSVAQPVIMTAMGLEAVRLAITILVHRGLVKRTAATEGV